MTNLAKENGSIEYAPLLIRDQLNIEGFAYESEFYKREPKKITAENLFFSFWNMQEQGKNTLSKWAFELSKLSGKTVEGQSLNERLNENCVKMCTLILNKILNQKTKKSITEKDGISELGKLFNRIILRDSTTQNLPNHLSNVFPGNYNKFKATAVMRIQACYDYSNHKWLQLNLGSFRDNDQGAADCISDILEPGDLILQDMGYFSLAWLRQLIDNQYIITKWKPGTYLYSLEDKKIDLLRFVKGKKRVDIQVLVGQKEKLPMRLVARKLPKEKAKIRVDKARNNRHSKAKHSKEYIELLKYEIYLTNVSEEILDGKGIAKLYGLRWHIEIIFKSWKSGTNFKKMFQKEKMHEHRVKFTIYAMLIQFVYLMSNIYPFVKESISKITDRRISIMLFMEEMVSSIGKIIMLKDINELMHNTKAYAKRITYERHTKRANTIDKYMYVNIL